MNKPQNLDLTRQALLANAGPFRAVQGPFIYSLTQIDKVPVDDTRGGRKGSDISTLRYSMLPWKAAPRAALAVQRELRVVPEGS